MEKYQFVKHLYDNKNIPIDKACKQAGISKATFYRIILFVNSIKSS
ncbi:helix-turn-helix domain-containing protein [Chryseobacterium rhizosphaerae]|nr:helix-turn-helix domain-containing protein [Chryseobacterium rhizosphaerae]MDC8102323.1 helix-turn-helix domain-containing protein [Chryseobacterium rhizosphaerae]